MNKNLKSQPKKALSQLHEIEIVYRRPITIPKSKVHTSKEAYDLFWEFCDKDKIDYKEFFFVLLLNRVSRPLGISCIGTGGFASVVVNQQEIFQLCLKTNACGMILCHNHPSGNLEPSEPDNQITKKLKDGGKLLDIQLLDHLIITSEGYYSYADEGLI